MQAHILFLGAKTLNRRRGARQKNVPSYIYIPPRNTQKPQNREQHDFTPTAGAQTRRPSLAIYYNAII